MNRIQTRALVEGAIFATITVVIGIIRFYIPIISLISIVWSVPTILIAFRHGFKVSVYSVVVSSALVAIVTQPIQGLGFFIGFGLPGMIMGYLLKKKLNPWKTIFITGIVLAVCSAVSIYLGMLVVGVNLAQAYDQIFIDMKNAYTEATNSIAGLYGSMGVNHEELEKGIAAFEKSMDMVKLIFPGGILFSGIMISFINFKLARLVLRRTDHLIEDVKPFSLWRLSHRWTVVFMAVLLLAAAEAYLIKLPQLHAVSMNVFTVAMIFCMVFGLSVTKFFLDKYSVPKALKGILMFLLLALFSNITALIGIFDMVFDVRKLRNQSVD